MGITVTKESCAIKTVCRRLGFAGVETGHEKVVRSFLNSWDAFVSLVNWQWKIWMPIRLLQGLSVCWQRFPGLSFLCDWNLQGRQLCNKLSLDSIIVWHSTSTLYMTYITFLKMICHNVCNYMEQKWNRQFTSPSMAKNGLGTGLITI